MRRVTLWAMATVAALVLLFSYRTSTMGTAGGDNSPVTTAAAPRATATGGPAGDGTGGATNPSPSGSGSAGTGQQASAAAPAGGTFKGSVVQTRHGAIQVTITVADGKITDVAVPVHPDGNRRDEEINDRALPILIQSTLDAQNAEVGTVSGATVTSVGYRKSLQSAIDKAHLA